MIAVSEERGSRDCGMKWYFRVKLRYSSNYNKRDLLETNSSICQLGQSIERLIPNKPSPRLSLILVLYRVESDSDQRTLCCYLAIIFAFQMSGDKFFPNSCLSK